MECKGNRVGADSGFRDRVKTEMEM
jgi:hypothetical protein